MASGIIPTGNESDDLGIIALLWKKIFTKDLHVTGDITDGTNTITVAEMTSSSGGGFTNVITPPTLTSTADNYNPTGFDTSDMVRQDINANNRQISGLKAPSPAEYIIKRINNLHPSNDLRFLHEDGGSDPENRILLRDGANKAIKPNETAEFYYDVVQSRWKPLNRIG
ncbi:MAG: hypothetical protein NZ604_06605 [Flavobacteriales bacterium]|nr:hypothetical protein [Flavobacteriales bacterium]